MTRTAHNRSAPGRSARTMLIALAGLALAMPASHAASQQNRDKPRTTSSSISITTTDNGEVRKEHTQIIDGVEYELTMRNDEIVSVTVDGLALDKDAYEHTPDAVIIRDGDQEITFDLRDSGTIRLFGEAGKGLGVQVFPRGEMIFPGGFADENGAFWTPANPPKTMVGISQTSVGEQLREHLGLEEGVGLVVIEIVDDLPADKAGIKEGDVIVEIAGEPVRNSAQLTDALRQREPGDTLGMVVLRKGVPQSLELELVAYDAKKLQRDAQVFGLNQNDRFFPGILRPDAPDAPAVDMERFREQFERQIREAERQAAQAAREGERLNELLIRRGDRAIVIEREGDRLRDRAEELRRLRDDANERIWDLIEELQDADTDAVRAELSKQLESARELATKLHRELEPLRRAAEEEIAPRFENDARAADRIAREAEAGLAARNQELEARLESLEARLDRLLSALEKDEPAREKGE